MYLSLINTVLNLTLYIGIKRTMNYRLHYDSLIARAKNRIPPVPKEDHHIIPRCMNGTDDASNVASLTPEEHFLAHQLLVKIYPGNKKLISALSKMCSHSPKNKRNNKWYGWIRKLYTESVSGENNPSAKFTNNQVVEIYHSTNTIDQLCKEHRVVRYNIITIKRKIYYRNVTKDITELPGCNDLDLYGKGGGFPLPIDLIESVFYDTGDYEYFWNRYRLTAVAIRSIKKKKSWKKITSGLGTPGQVKRYNLTNDDVENIIASADTLIQLSEKYGVHLETIRNIKKGITRHEIWEEF